MKRDKIHIPVDVITKLSRTETIAGSITALPIVCALNFGLGRIELGFLWFTLFAIGFFYVKQNGKEIHNKLEYIKMLNKDDTA